MQRFFQIPNCAAAFQHKIYGFYTSPIIDYSRPYEDILLSVLHSLSDYTISYENFHVELNIQMNPASVSEFAVLDQIQQICRIHGKELT